VIIRRPNQDRGNESESTPALFFFRRVSLMQALRRLGLKGTQMAAVQCNTIRLELLYVGTHVEITVRKVWLFFADGYPYGDPFYQAVKTLES
jgi:hypothetical protein